MLKKYNCKKLFSYSQFRLLDITKNPDKYRDSVILLEVN